MKIDFILIWLVLLMPLGFAQHSIQINFENKTLMGDGIERYSEADILNIANQYLINKIPEIYRNELKSTGVDKGPGYFNLGWRRYINNILVNRDRVAFRIDYSNGNIILAMINFNYPTSEINSHPSITADQIDWLVKKNYGTAAIKTPTLLIEGKDLLWIVDIPDASLGIDAHTGETKTLAVSQGGIEKLQTRFDPVEYYLEVYGIYLFIAAIVLGGGFIYFKTSLFSRKRR